MSSSAPLPHDSGLPGSRPSVDAEVVRARFDPKVQLYLWLQVAGLMCATLFGVLARRDALTASAPAPLAEAELLREIRDALHRIEARLARDAR
jgi:hypothetical protein